MNDPIIPDVDENGAQVRQLDQSQEFASTRSPDEAAGTMDYAKRAGLDFQVAEKMKPQYPWLAKNQTSWGNLVKDHPVLADHLADPGFASVAKDDVHNLSMMERLFGGWDDMAWASKLALEGDTRSQELAKIGRAQRYGKATPEMLKRADELDKEPPAPQMGFLPGIVPSVVGMLPGLARASGTAAAFAGGGALLGSAVPGVGTVGGALAMGGAGFVAGMAMDSASTEQGIAFRDYTKMGADPQTAGVAADIVALANGGLQAIPAEKVLNIVPGLKGLLVGQGTRDVMRRLIASNTGRAALTRFAGRVAESGLLMALIGSSQELIRETGAIASGADTQYHGGRIWDAGVGGAQQGLGFGIATKALPLRGDLVEAKAAENRSTLYKTLGQIATDSKLRERMPDAYKSYANAVIKKYGKVDEVKAPAEALANLFQKEGVTNEQLQEVMPEVAKQLRESKPTDEVVIPMADLATHVAGLKGFPELSSDLRVGDELTPREAKAVVAEAEKAQAAHEATKKEIDSGEATPARKVYDEVFSKLTEAGHAPEVAGPDATLWAAFAKARGERLGIDPYEYFSKRAVNIGAEFKDGPIELGQGPDEYGGLHRPPRPDGGAPLHDLTGGGQVYPDDVYGPDAARLYGHGEGKLDRDTMQILQSLRGKPDAEITVYRAVPKGTKGSINAGDWITVNKEYAKQHGARFAEGSEIISKKVKASEVYTNGDSIHEAGYWPKTVTLEQAAHHGSPYRFDKFTLDKIGSGEGAQSYGWGLYFAESKGVADYYKKKLSRPQVYLNGAEPKDYFERSIADTLKARGLGNPLSFEAARDSTIKMYKEMLDNGELNDVQKRGYEDRIEYLKNLEHASLSGDFKYSAKKLGETILARLEEKIKTYEDHPLRAKWDKWFKESDAIMEKRADYMQRVPKASDEEVKSKFPVPEEPKASAEFDTLSREAGRIEAFRNEMKEALANSEFKDKSDPGRKFFNPMNVYDLIYKHMRIRGEGLGIKHQVSSFEERTGIKAKDLFNPEAKGTSYEVDLPGKEDFLDYDQAIVGQNPSVLEKLEKAGLLPAGLSKKIEKYQELTSIMEGKKDEIAKRYYAGHGLDEAYWRAEMERVSLKNELNEDHVKLPDGRPIAVDTPNFGEQFYNALALREGGEDKNASTILQKAGLPGLKYLDQGSRATVKGEQTHNFVVWDEESIKILSILEQRAGEGYRGKISFDPGRTFFNITLTGKANLSTFLHESGHAFLEFMRADAANGTVDPDLAKVYEYLGVKPGEEPSVPQLETFARSFEAYLREGKAPSTGLREAFRTFGAWLKMIYKSLTGLGVDLNDDIRGVMDRMLATDSEIEEARENLGFEPMKKPKEMPPEEYATYKERFAKAVEDTRDRLQEQALRAFSRTIGEERSKVRSEVEEKLKTDRAQNAFEALSTGKRLDGAEVPEEVRGQKISRAAIEDYPGFKETKKWTSITDAKGGGDPEVLAPYYGFTSGQEMLDALNARRPRSVEIKEETERRMREKYPDAEMGAMADQAVKSFHEEGSVEKVLWTEAAETAKYLSGLEEQHAQAEGRDLRVQKAKIKEIANRRVESMTALELQPGRFARAEEAAARESAKAFRAGDFSKAHEEKLSQIANHELWKRVSAAKEETEGIRDYLNRFNELPTRRKVGKAGQSYIEAIDKIITDIELKRVTNKEIARRASLEAYLKKMEDEDGAVLNIPEELRSESSLKNYKTMTLEELRTVRDAVKNIESMARLKNRLFDGREYREWNATGVKAAEHVRANLGTPYAEKASDPQNPGWWDKKKTWLREAAAEKKKIEFVARELDGGQTAGFMHELLFQPFATAEARRHTLTEKITETLLKPLRELNIKERIALDRTVDFLGTPMRMRDVISVALNMGNEGNKRKLIEGYGYRGWTEEAVTKRLGELLTDKHLDLVQHFWDTIGQLWPDIKELSERTTGLPPPKVDPTSLVINGRELKGGYYPIVYDRSRDYKAEQIAQKKGDLWENNFLKPGVSKGFTEARTQFYAPLLLSLNVIPSHINEVVHYLTHYEATRAVDRLLNHKELRKAITEGLGRETYNLFRPWLQAIAHDGVVPGNLTLMDGILRHLRVGAAVTRLGFRVTNSIMQGFNLLSSVKELGGAIDGPKYLGIGIKRWMEDVDSFRDPFAGIYSKSPELAGKASKIEHEMVNNFDHFTSAFSEFGHLKNQLGHFAMSFMTLAWKTCDTITWYAAREKAMDENHPRPLEYADSVVRMSQMGEGIKDKAAIMRGGEGVKIFTNMYSWYSVIYNQLSETQPQSRTGWQKTGELASRWWWMVLAPSVAMGLARGKGPSKDKDNPASWLKYYGEEIALEAAKPWPVAGVAVDALLGEHEAKFAPWIATVLKGIKARGKAAEGEKLSDGEKKALVESTGITSHLPATALWNAYRYVSAVTDGKLEEPIRDLLFRAPGEWK